MQPSGPHAPAAPEPGASNLARRPAAALAAPRAGDAQVLLFRSEAVSEQRTRSLGTVLLTPRLSHGMFTLLGVLAAGAIIGLLLFADFTRTARVNGWLVPQGGVMQVFAPRLGVITQLHVEEGAQVKRGDPLLTLSDERQSSALGATQAQIGRRLDEQIASLRDARLQQQQLQQQQQQALGGRVQALKSEQEQIEREVGLLASRLQIAQRAESLQNDLRRQGFISENGLQRAQADRLDQGVRLGALERDRSTLARERMMVEAELRELPLKIQREIGIIDRSLSQLEQQRAQAEAQREIVIPAPQDGTVTTISAVRGGQAQASLPLLSIVPHDSNLVAHLYSPSRAMGFVRPGQRVLLRYDSYPYQRFGHHEGVLANVSRAAVAAADVPKQLAAQGTAGSGDAAGAAAEPLYRITVRLLSQTVTAYGEPIRLQPGMALEADVTLERRRLYEWVLDPLYTLTGKWQG